MCIRDRLNSAENRANNGGGTIILQTKEIFGPALIHAKHGIAELDLFQNKANPSLSVNILWSPYHSQKQPGKSCQIILEQPDIAMHDFTKAVIDKDPDWDQKATNKPNIISGHNVRDKAVTSFFSLFRRAISRYL